MNRRSSRLLVMPTVALLLLAGVAVAGSRPGVPEGLGHLHESFAEHVGDLPDVVRRRLAEPLERAGWRWQDALDQSRQGARDTTIDLGRSQTVSALLYRPVDDSDAIADFEVRTSTDGSGWSEPVTAGSLPGLGGEQTIELPASPVSQVRLTSRSRGADGRAPVHADRVQLLGAPDTMPPAGTVVLPRQGWTVTASSQETQQAPDSAANVLDGRRDTFWHSRYSNPRAELPQSITIDMGSSRPVSALTYYARTGRNPNGAVGRYEVVTSTDGQNFGAPVASGTWRDYDNVYGTHKVAHFDRTVNARYVRLVVRSAANGQPYASAAEIELSGPADDATHGRWGNLISFETLPVASTVLPDNKLLVWAAHVNDNYLPNSQGKTQTEIYDLTTRTTQRRTVDETGHDMFCPGTVILSDGRIMVTGGNNAEKVSVYDPTSRSWTAAPRMQIARGYQAMTPMPNGDAFVLGGSWGPAANSIDKVGEVWDSRAGRWRKLPAVKASETMTADVTGAYRGDNHMWLYATSNGKIFHAGPSKTMHWIDPAGQGALRSAGPRGDNASDAMAGVSVMYDVDKILTFGGGRNYDRSPASNRSVAIDVSVGSAQAREQKPLHYARSFATGVALPNGQVLAFGGQGFSEPFSDMDSVLTPEIWDPASGEWTALASSAVPRNYHSVANLLPDGTVFSGGGGLCGTGCKTNHFNGQIFTPPYLLNPDGSAKRRPVLSRAPATTPNSTPVRVEADGEISGFVLMRNGASTHGVDNDQRRVPVASIRNLDGSFTVFVPGPATAVPGRYMLFALGTNGAPSIAKTMLVTGDGPPPAPPLRVPAERGAQQPKPAPQDPERPAVLPPARAKDG